MGTPLFLFTLFTLCCNYVIIKVLYLRGLMIMEKWQFIQRQNLPFEAKLVLTNNLIREAYERFDGKIYVSVSGLDSQMLLHMVRQLYPDVIGVFNDTGLEWPSVRNSIKLLDNIVTIRPEKDFKSVIEEYGYPVISKEQSQYIYEVRTTKSEKLREMRLKPSGSYRISNKWRYFLAAPFKVSHKCCYWLKKKPFAKFEKETGLIPVIGIQASESSNRLNTILRNGCNAFDGNKPQSRPQAHWHKEDVWAYQKLFGLSYPDIYDKGWTQTGCMFCLYGVHLEDAPNRFQRMKEIEPKIYDYCINKLQIGQVLDYMGIPY